ncbi:MAG: PA14 domain-containing protein [Opitutales bacterium]
MNIFTSRILPCLHLVISSLAGILSAADEHKHHAHQAVGPNLVAEQTPQPPPKGFEQVDLEIDVETLRGQMRYDLDNFQVTPGAKVRLTLKNNDDMPHNLVLCRPIRPNIGAEVARKAWDLGGEGIAKQYVPDHPAILFHTNLVAPHTSAIFYFKAPTKTGQYPYVCTLPGHVFYMKGTMIVGKGISTPSGKPAGLSETTYKVFAGSWDRLPDFSKLEPIHEGMLNRGKLLSHKVAKRKDAFALLFEGTLSVPNTGRYSFELGSDDGSRLEVNGKRIIDHDGPHPHSPKTGGINLKPGDHNLRLAYFQGSGPSSLALRWRGPGVRTAWLTKALGKGKGQAIPILPTNDGEAVIYRNFIAGSGTRSICVGYPQSVNLSFDANGLRLAMLWQGAFMDGGRHWNGRGQGFQSPAGYAKLELQEGPAFAFLESPESAWPKPADHGRAADHRFLGYERDKNRRPTFLYQFSDLKVKDFPVPAIDLIPYLTRSFVIEGSSGDRNLLYLAAAGREIAHEEDTFVVDGEYVADFPKGTNGKDPILRDSGGRRELLLPLSVDGKATFTQRYRWRFK